MGKSHYIERDAELSRLPVVSSDRELLKLCDEAGLSYHEGFQKFYLRAKDAMNKRLNEVLNTHSDFVYDRTNLTKGSRAKMIERLKIYGYEIKCLNFGVPSDKVEQSLVEVRRHERRRQYIPKEAFDTMCGQFVQPSLEEGFDEIRQIDMLVRQYAFGDHIIGSLPSDWQQQDPANAAALLEDFMQSHAKALFKEGKSIELVLKASIFAHGPNDAETAIPSLSGSGSVVVKLAPQDVDPAATPVIKAWDLSFLHDCAYGDLWPWSEQDREALKDLFAGEIAQGIVAPFIKALAVRA
ncbi:MAG: AAA family ATPase [Duodenibacillus sp.]|nr:AAA family ATPase [Duodenibacillus sp.]